MVKCPTCGAENADGSQFCTSCGAPLPKESVQSGVGDLPFGPMAIGPTPPDTSIPSQPATPTEPVAPSEMKPAAVPPPPPVAPIIPPPAYGQPPGGYAPQTSGPGSTYAILSLIFGIVSLFCCTSGFGVIFGPVAIVMAVLARRETTNANQGIATAGLVTGIVGSVLGVFGIIYIIVMFAYGFSHGMHYPAFPFHH